MVARAGNVFDDQGRMTDAQVRDRLKDFLAGLADFVGAQSG
jgi:hypothetical protein